MFSPKKEWFIITSGAAPVYKEANFNSPCFTEAIYGESCQILDHYENWIQIKCEDNYKGWVNSFYGHKSSNKNNPTHKVVFPNKMRHFDSKFPFGAKVNDSIEGTIPIIEKIGFEQIIPIAKNLLGTPYKWGGKTSLGIDCSGLVQSVLKACGLDIPRDSYQQQEFFVDDEISMNQTGRGDLHFFGTEESITHVGMVVEGNTFIHTQGYVKEESLDAHSTMANMTLIEKRIATCSIAEVLLA